MTAEEKLAAAFAAAIKGKLPPEAVKAAAAGQKVTVRVRLPTLAEKEAREREKGLETDQTAQGQILRTLAAGGYRPAAKETGEPSILAGWNKLAGGAK